MVGGCSCEDLAAEEEAVANIGTDGAALAVEPEHELAWLAKDSERFRIFATRSRSPIPRFKA